MNKKIIISSLAFLLCLGLVSCGNKDDTSSSIDSTGITSSENSSSNEVINKEVVASFTFDSVKNIDISVPLEKIIESNNGYQLKIDQLNGVFNAGDETLSAIKMHGKNKDKNWVNAKMVLELPIGIKQVNIYCVNYSSDEQSSLSCMGKTYTITKNDGEEYQKITFDTNDVTFLPIENKRIKDKYGKFRVLINKIEFLK